MQNDPIFIDFLHLFFMVCRGFEDKDPHVMKATDSASIAVIGSDFISLCLVNHALLKRIWTPAGVDPSPFLSV